MNGLASVAAGVVTTRRRPLHDEIVGKLRDMIGEGELEPGARVPEKLLCMRFGVSRTPLREALKVLASEGLIDLYLNRGAVIATLEMSALEEIFPLLGHLEAMAGELACAASPRTRSPRSGRCTIRWCCSTGVASGPNIFASTSKFTT
jgi:DNA-binding GntR family transcriptional regulator